MELLIVYGIMTIAILLGAFFVVRAENKEKEKVQ